jgi:hypothetical protein
MTGMPTRSDLDTRYAVRGSFYERPGRHAAYACRSALDIERRPRGYTELDAFVVMMNPGSSRPCNPAHAASGRPVATVPDATQYRIMTLMDRRDWRRVRVINLSDLRDPDSGRFVQQVRRYEREHGCADHSIFHGARAARLRAALSRHPQTPVIVAWGVTAELETLARRALEVLPAQRMVGRPGAQGGWRYWHPLPRRARWQQLWLDEVCSRLDDLVAADAHANPGQSPCA